ncbi:MAG: hypothetical protein ACE5FG_08410 [Myxococcota bacterium]
MASTPSRVPRPAPHELAIWTVLGLAVVGVLALFSLRCGPGPQGARAYASRSLPPEPRPVLRAPPPMDDEYLPCSDCHEDEPTNRRVRELEDEHEDTVLAHGDLWCLHCHDVDDRDRLRRADGRRIEFAESWRLCTQCHPKKRADWEAGVHGKRMGNWWGPKEYWTCVACHDPHTPRFEPLEPMPPPTRPEAIRLSRAQEAGRAP